jgi:RNA polymerase sigma factor (sigma-70 family)
MGYTLADMDDGAQIEVLLPELKAYATSVCRDPNESDDLVQDAVVRFIRSEKKPTDLGDIRPWMFRAIRNLFYDDLRKRKVRKRHREIVQHEAGPSNHQSSQHIKIAFDKLSPDMREILFLVDIAEFKYTEIADILNVPVGTVMSRVSRSRKCLLILVRSIEAEDANFVYMS